MRQSNWTAAAAAQLNVAPPKALKKVQVKVPVKSIKCGHGGMDDNVYKALKADESADISYILATFEAVPGEAKDSFMLHTIGTLTIRGKREQGLDGRGRDPTCRRQRKGHPEWSRSR
jgi:polyisoprenoid-binding protein YceI